MPRIVDHEERRREVLDAATRLIIARGLRGVTVRELASEAGMASSTLRHYVPRIVDLEQLLVEHHAARVQERIARELARSPRPEPLELVARCEEQVLPLDDERRVEYDVAHELAVGGSAPHETTWAWQGQVLFHRQMVLVLAGEDVPNRPPPLPPGRERWVRHLHTYVDGIAYRARVASPEEIASMLRDALAVIQARVATEAP